MVRKIGQSLLNVHGGMGGGGVPSTFLFSNFRANTIGPIWKFFHWQMLQGCAYKYQIQNLFGIIIIIIARTIEKKTNLVLGWTPPPPPPLLAIRELKFVSSFRSSNFVHFSNQLKLTQKNVNPLNFTRNKRCVHSFWFHLNVEVV